MRFAGTTDFVADQPEIYAFLVDPTRMGPCAPVPIERVDQTHFKATAKVGSGFFAATVSLELELVEAVEDERARLEGRGRGSGTTLTASTSFLLRKGTMAGVTTVDWVADLELEGMLAGPASRIIAEQGERAISRLFECLRAQLEG